MQFSKARHLALITSSLVSIAPAIWFERISWRNSTAQIAEMFSMRALCLSHCEAVRLNGPPMRLYFLSHFLSCLSNSHSLVFLAERGAVGRLYVSLNALLRKFSADMAVDACCCFFLFLPAALAAGEGQDSFLLLLIFVIAAVSFYRNRDWSSGLCLGLALFQFQFAIPVALLFLLFKRWRIFCGFCISGAAVAGISAAMVGARGSQLYIQSVVSRFSPGSLQAGASIDRAAIPNIRCLLSLLFGAHIGPEVLFALILACSVLLILWAGTRTPNFALATMVAVLVSFKGNIGDTVLLLIPIAFVLDARLAIFSGWRRTWMRNLVALLFIAPSLLYLVKLPYCLLVFLMLPLLMPLRFASSDWQPRPSEG